MALRDLTRAIDQARGVDTFRYLGWFLTPNRQKVTAWWSQQFSSKSIKIQNGIHWFWTRKCSSLEIHWFPSAAELQKCNFVSIYAPARTLNHAHIAPEPFLKCLSMCWKNIEKSKFSKILWFFFSHLPKSYPNPCILEWNHYITVPIPCLLQDLTYCTVPKFRKFKFFQHIDKQSKASSGTICAWFRVLAGA